MKALVGAFKMPMEMAGFDPQKVAKNQNSNAFMEGEVNKARIIEQAGETTSPPLAIGSAKPAVSSPTAWASSTPTSTD
jgi:hypothetical protein